MDKAKTSTGILRLILSFFEDSGRAGRLEMTAVTATATVIGWLNLKIVDMTTPQNIEHYSMLEYLGLLLKMVPILLVVVMFMATLGRRLHDLGVTRILGYPAFLVPVAIIASGALYPNYEEALEFAGLAVFSVFWILLFGFAFLLPGKADANRYGAPARDIRNLQ